MKKAVFTFKIDASIQEEDKALLDALASVFEAFGCEVYSELSYEEVNENE